LSSYQSWALAAVAAAIHIAVKMNLRKTSPAGEFEQLRFPHKRCPIDAWRQDKLARLILGNAGLFRQQHCWLLEVDIVRAL
jgi:hypothetical protein